MGMALADLRHAFVVCEGEPATDLTFKELFATADGGTTWTLRSRVENGQPGIGQIPLVGSDSQLSFVSPRLGFLMADRNGIERTTDGGRTFRPLLFTDDVTDVVGTSWITHDRGYVALYHGGLLRTDDGGSHWTVVYPHPVPHPVQTLAFATPTKGIGTGSDAFLSGPRALFVTDSSGRAWEPVRPPAGATLGQPVYASPRVVLALGSFPLKRGSREGLLRSDDGGLHWERLAVPTEEPVSISFPSPGVGFLADRSGRLFRTEDGGTGWSQVGTETGITSLQFASGRVGWAMQWPASASNGELIRTADGGRTWGSVPLPRLFRLDTIGFLDARHGWLEGFRCSGTPPSGLPQEKTSGCGHPRPTLLRTADGGASWDEIDLPFPFDNYGLDFVTPRIGFTLEDFLYRTSDGGVTWRAVVPPGL